MGQQTELPAGLTRRKRPDGTYYEDIYFDKLYRGRRIRGSSGTDSAEEAERRLRRKLTEIDNVDIYRIRPDRTFEEAATHYLKTDPRAHLYLSHLESMMPFVGNVLLRRISKETFRDWIAKRYQDGVSARTVNFGLVAARRIIRLCAYSWRDEHGLTWLSKDDVTILAMETGPKLQPYPLSWQEQDALFAHLPARMRDMCLFKVNSGCRANEVVQLRWAWEKDMGIGETIFLVPGEMTKNGKPHYVVLNSIARTVIDRWRGKDADYVFGKPMFQLSNNVWREAWANAIGDKPGHRCGVHNLKHTFGKRLRDAGVDERSVSDLLHHQPQSITRHYSQPELRRLREYVELIVRKPQLRAVS